ncbi:hypothetical protein [Sphingomonas sp.]|uniref:hypothetical protein n=1 Tax=Sphingomonas sp. TaxID=28214 RepID=UPI003B3AC606
MDFDDLLVRFFGTAAIDTLDPERLAKGADLVRLQFGLERDPERRFDLWCLMYLLGTAPDPDATFQDEDDREAAHAFMAEAEQAIGDDA